MSLGVTLAHTISAHSTDVNAIAFKEDALASCSGDKTCKLWSLDDYSELASSPLLGHTYSVHCCVFSPTGSILVTCSTDGRAILWDVKTGNKVGVFEHKSQQSIRVCRFSRDGSMMVTGSDDESLCLWNVPSQKVIRYLEGHEASVVACSFSPDGAYVASGSNNGDLRVWDAKYGHGKYLILDLDGHDLGVTGMEFSPTYSSAGTVDHRSATVVHFLLATCGNDNLVKLWDLLAHTGSSNVQLHLRDSLLGHGAPVMAISFSPNGKYLASGSGDKTIKIWDPIKGSTLHTIDGHSRYVTCCAFSLDNQFLASGSNDKMVKIWHLDTDNSSGDITYEDDVLIDVSGSSSSQVQECTDSYVTWNTEQVCEWLGEIGMAQYMQNFRKNAIDGAELKSLTHESLQSSLNIIALGHRNKILRAIEHIQSHPIIQTKDATDDGIADEYLCPITREVMKEPVIASDGYSYERAAITSWMKSGKTRSPMTNALLTSTTLTTNRSLKMLIQRHMQQHKT